MLSRLRHSIVKLQRRSALVVWTGGLLLFTGCARISPPATQEQIATFTGSVAKDLRAATPVLSGTLDVDAAVERAVAFNQEVLAAQLAVAIEEAQGRIDRGQLLPEIMAQSEYYRRSNRLFSRSYQSSVYSSSSDLANITNSIDLSLNLLDFGLTLIRMRQDADRANIKREDIRRVALRISEETRGAYWRAVALQTLVPVWMKLQPKVGEALQLSQRASQDAALDPVEFINAQRDLLNTRRELNDVFSQLAGAEFQLRNLASIPPESTLQLDRRRNEKALPLPKTSAEQDIAVALQRRPEMRQHLYEARITEQEVCATVLKVLPGATLTGSFRSDSSAYLLHGNWLDWSARIAANLIEAVRLPAKLDAVDAQQEVNRQNAIVTASAIAMQVYVARARLAVEFSIYRDADDFSRNQQVLLKQVRNSVLAGKLPEQLIAREELAALLAEVRAIVAFGDLHAAYASYQAAIGQSLDGLWTAFNE